MLVRSDEAWDYAIGMLKADGLESTPEMMEMIEKEKRGEITMEEIKKALDRRYKKTQTEGD
ncbi:MAG: antitoxin VbhA family protein [Lachnospiraceae bacterium]|nr:antitoxin VbhA family protein [Lachnospiraceae bacterium]